MQWIGEKKVKLVEGTAEKTPGGLCIVKVTYEDETVEHFSDVMFDKVVSEERCDLSALRDKRCHPVVEVLLAVLREWGIKTSELGYISALLNNSLDANKNAALNALWAQWGPKLMEPDEVSLLTIDRVLRSHGTNSVPEDKK